MTEPDDQAAACALAGLPGMGPAGLARLLAAHGEPAAAWAALRSGRIDPGPARGPDRRAAWAAAAARADPAALWAAAAERGISVTWRGAPGYPRRLAEDPEAPGVLFWRGSIDALSGPCVGLVGTRRCTPDGSAVAGALGRDLAAAGICVISGLALGVDGAAHRGALSSGAPAATVGVAASGADVVYPPAHAKLWEEVVARGAVVSETAPGRPAQAWRFPARNRIIAAVVDLLVVVESHAAGGSMLTVDAALARGVEVGAVPGPVRSPASAGTNRLLSEGAAVIRSADDVLDALGRLRGPPKALRAEGRTTRAAGGRDGFDERTRSTQAPQAAQQLSLGLSPAERTVLDAVAWRPTSFNAVVVASGLGVASTAGALDDLVDRGMVEGEGGWWRRLA